MTETIQISVVICSHNPEPKLLAKVLDAIARQSLKATRWELVLIDNASDPAIEMPNLDTLHGRVHVIVEPTLGLSHSRMRGVTESRGSYIVFVDDDNILADDYLTKAVKLMEARPDIGVLGGRSVPEAEVTLPHWFPTYASNYAVGVQAIESGDVSSRTYVWGAGMVVRGSVLREFIARGVSPLLTDRRGAVLSSGGDCEICRWFLLTGYKLWYDEQLVLRHVMNADRLTKAYLQGMLQRHYESAAYLLAYDLVDSRSRLTFAERLKALCVSLLRLMFRPRCKDTRRQLEALGILPCLVFDPDIRAIKRTVQMLRDCRASVAPTVQHTEAETSAVQPAAEESQTAQLSPSVWYFGR